MIIPSPILEGIYWDTDATPWMPCDKDGNWLILLPRPEQEPQPEQ